MSNITEVKTEKKTGFEGKLAKLKKTQTERGSRTFDIYVDEWEETLKVRRLTTKDHAKAKSWVKKYYPLKSEEALEAAFICICVKDSLPLSEDNVDFLLGEPFDVIAPLKQKILKISGIQDLGD